GAPALLRWRVLRDVGVLGALALGEEEVPQRLRLGGGDALREQLTLALGALIESQLQAGLDRLDDRVRRAQAPGGFLQRRAHRLAGLEPGFHGVRGVGDVADLARFLLALRERDRAAQQIPIDDL